MVRYTKEAFEKEVHVPVKRFFDLTIWATRDRKIQCMQNPGIALLFSDYGHFELDKDPNKKMYFKLIVSAWVNRSRFRSIVQEVVVFESEEEFLEDRAKSEKNQIKLNQN